MMVWVVADKAGPRGEGRCRGVDDGDGGRAVVGVRAAAVVRHLELEGGGSSRFSTHVTMRHGMIPGGRERVAARC
jgi:hypothetical protein